ncbi:OmpH family outer membrane protein [Anaplasma phagocytophilum]|uniref:Outer membrane family protein n=2 Tax=Anaplasma phagocytophilum TaxID=948 RepID=A0A0F3PP15_ANAPH|nr:OmpH family outer membrane protein [Anaplasma phagocytophilum]EOA62659.1 hypothetical protein CRT38_05327 [Anaplasma phagocytophilum str. CRT38]KDB56738.1 hypothetical protein P030_00900 [Anaplasma phagocytophilum str. CRT35]KJV82075.1 outer membrane family protein [Anaplasma phagocytophilum str. CRT53-1]
MKIVRIVVLALALVVFLNCSVGVNAASGTEDRPVLFVDSDRVLSEALVAKDIRAQLDRRRTEMQGAFAHRGEKLRKEEEDLVKQKGILSSEAFEVKVMEFRQAVEAMNKDVETKMSELEVMYGNAIAQVYDKIQKISELQAAEKGASVVLFMSRGQASYVDEKADITEKILETLNKDLSRVSLGN